MKLQVEWARPIVLRDASSDNMIYSLDLDRVTDRPGIYIFGRRWGSVYEALYVGKAGDVRARVRGHLNNLRLMQHLRNARTGKRILLAGKYMTRRGQQVDKCLQLTERALIRYFLSEGHELVNVQGTRLRRHELESTGHPRQLLPAQIYLERGRGD